MRIIGLSGKIGCGKTSVARILLDLIPRSVRFAFGDQVKREAAVIYGFPEDLAFSELGKLSHIVLSRAGAVLMGRAMATVRGILQYHGTDLRRAQNPGYWIDAAARALAVFKGNGVPVVIVDDVRFPGEAELIHRLGGTLCRLQPFPGWVPGPNAGHASETSLDEWVERGVPGFDKVFFPACGPESLAAVAREIASGLGYV